MAENSTSTKGKNKRIADDEEVDDSDQDVVSDDFTTPQVLRRYRHRRHQPRALWLSTVPVSRTPQTPKRSFNTYKAILRHPNLFFQFALRLPPQAIIDLYAIDKEFHYRLNKYSTSIVHDYAHYHAPEAAFVFSWVLFPELCISDPMLKPMDGRPYLARDIPSFRWTKMVLYRDSVVREILTRLALEGHRVPASMAAVLMRFWVLMEMNTNALRKAFLRDLDVWKDEDIVLFQLFLVKLDMRFSCPVQGNGICELSHLLLTQKSLTMLRDVLSGKMKLEYDDATDIMIRTYLIEDLDTETHPWMDDEMENGVPEEQSGLLCREGWDQDGGRMEPAVDLVIEEGERRGLDVQRWYLDFVMYGFVDEESEKGRNLSGPRMWKGDKGVVVAEEAWPVETERLGMIEKLDKNWGIEEEEERTRRAFVSADRRRFADLLFVAWMPGTGGQQGGI